MEANRGALHRVDHFWSQAANMGSEAQPGWEYVMRTGGQEDAAMDDGYVYAMR